VTDFDFDRVDLDLADEAEAAESMHSMSDMSSAITQAHGNDDTPQSRLLAVAARCEALLWLIQPTKSQFKSLSEIADAAGLTKASVSKSLLNFRDSVGLRICAGKRNYTRDTYRRAQ
jgi:hypothetical protein